MAEVAIYNQEAKKTGTVELPDEVFGLRWNADLVHQVMEAERANRRQRVAHIKMRGEVAGGGKKPWRQKGTGRARHGSIRSPLWRKGGVTHGPNAEKVFEKKINKKMSAKAIATVLSQKLREHELLVVDAFSIPDHKTKHAHVALQGLAGIKGYELLGSKGGKVLILYPKSDKPTVLGVRNLPYADVKNASMAQVSDLLSYKYLLVPKDAVEVLKKKIGK